MENPPKPPADNNGKPTFSPPTGPLIVKRHKFLIVIAAFCLVGGTLLVRSQAAPDSPQANGPQSNYGVGAAATAFNWGSPNTVYDFNDTGDWSIEDNGLRINYGYKDMANVSASSGLLEIHGRADGHTGGLAADDERLYGRYEVRSRVTPVDGKCWRPVMSLQPSGEKWSAAGIVFAAGEGSLSSVDFNLQYGPGNSRTSSSAKVDMTQWHDFAVEWTAKGVKGYVDGRQFFSDDDPAHVPSLGLRPVLGLDSRGQSEVCSSETLWQIDWMKVYDV